MCDENKLNIYFKSDEVKSNIFNGSSSHERYIILMNETLQTENRNLSAQLKELENKISESEEEIDRYDVSKRYTKGLLKNLVELDKFKSIIANNNENIANKTSSDLNDYKIKARRHVRILAALMFVLFGVFWETKFFNNMQFFAVFFIAVFNNAFMENMISNLVIQKFLEEKDENLKVKESIKKISDSQDFLNDYIDNI